MKPHIVSALRIFYSGCDRASGMRSIYEYLKNTAPAALNCDDILRSSLVLVVSSFDLYIHDIFRTEALHRLSFGKEIPILRVPFNAALLNGAAQAAMIENCIRKDNSFKSFVAPEKLAECLRQLTENPWDKVAEKLGASASSCKARLKGVVDLRNRIAHEADVNPAYGGIELWPIYSEDIENSIIFLRELGTAIARAVTDNQ
ncbi:HEPN domain-containing protein [uncultured Methylobacterium sp.]|uniref:HEPN domain-containing protein n=1 Tax=uncultured Methylobacterium sp. TaxID=157278 RepID=UPI0035CC14B2